MFPVTSRVTCIRAMPGVYRLYYQSRRVGEAVTIDSEATSKDPSSPAKAVAGAEQRFLRGL
jgi:hypothetical protein